MATKWGASAKSWNNSRNQNLQRAADDYTNSILKASIRIPIKEKEISKDTKDLTQECNFCNSFINNSFSNRRNFRKINNYTTYSS